MALAASATLIAELDDAVTGASPERRVQILKQMMELFMSDARRLDDAHASMFDEIFVRMIERLELKTLARLSVVLSEADAAPRQAVRRLAFHEDVTVAAPVLTRSAQLSEADLIEIANTRGPQHLLAIAGRNDLKEALTDALIRRGNAAVSNALAQNRDARFSERGYATLVGQAERGREPDGTARPSPGHSRQPAAGASGQGDRRGAGAFLDGAAAADADQVRGVHQCRSAGSDGQCAGSLMQRRKRRWLRSIASAS